MKQLFAIVFILFILFGKAQVDNTTLYINQTDDTLLENTPYVKLQSLGYMKDIENFGPMKDGYTLFGFQLNPQLGFQLSKHFSIEGGVYLRKDFGHKDFNDVLPTFSMRYQKNDFKMIFGNLDGSLNHGLIEPIYGFERVMTNRLENGAQFILKKKHVDFDAWIDWQNMLYRMVNDYERFWGGVSGNLYKVSSDKVELKMPLQFTVRHNGGQIARGGTINGGNETVYTNMNGSVGLFGKLNLNNKKLRGVYADVRYVFNKNNNVKDTSVWKHFGDGISANIGMSFKRTDIMFTYWYGGDYTSEFGGDLYSSSSTSIVYAGTYQSYRNLAILRVTHRIKLANEANLMLRFEPQYDIDFSRFNFDLGFYIQFSKRVNLKQI